MRPGLYPDLPDADYRAAGGVSCSVLKRFARAPALAHAPQATTDAMRAGQRLHAAVLEAWQFDTRYAVTDLDRRGTKAWQEAEAEAIADGRTLLKRAEWEDAARIRDAVHAHPVARDLLAPGLTTETAAFWTDREHDCLCRGRLDAVRRDLRVLVDVKTTGDAGPWKFSKSAADLKIHWQAAWYLDGIAAAPGGFRPDGFVVLAIEREAPFLIAAYEFGVEELRAGRAQVRDALRQYLECEKAGRWPGYPETITPLHLPAWALLDKEEAFP